MVNELVKWYWYSKYICHTIDLRLWRSMNASRKEKRTMDMCFSHIISIHNKTRVSGLSLSFPIYIFTHGTNSNATCKMWLQMQRKMYIYLFGGEALKEVFGRNTGVCVRMRWGRGKVPALYNRICLSVNRILPIRCGQLSVRKYWVLSLTVCGRKFRLFGEQDVIERFKNAVYAV